ncbi:MAG: hypothetical protein KF833_03780 [Verrucomicrobiae bacterium]|nr:hypothetical protein [Verrucomicrobiae bacterium]
MLEAIEKLLKLQDRDRRLLRLRAEVADVDPQRRLIEKRRAAAEQEFEASRQNGLRLESERKRLELEVEAKKEQIAKYAGQQWQTRKNEEYKALSHEIATCKEVIRGLEDQQLVLMEQLEEADKRLAAATEAVRLARADSEAQLKQCAETEARLCRQLAEAEAARTEFGATVEEGLLARYERILKTKGDRVVVGIERGVCGGCHMKLARQDVLTTQAGREIVHCANCGRILYYLHGMDLKAAD